MVPLHARSLLVCLINMTVVLAPSGVAVAAAEGPVVIKYRLSALAEPDQYEYRYKFINDSSSTPVSWFSIDFDTALYDESSLQINSSDLGDWSQQLLTSVLNTPAQFDAYKNKGAPLETGSFAEGFAVQFSWLGSGKPGRQAFAVYDPGNLSILYSGLTVAVPESSTLALILAGLCGLAVVIRRRPAQPEMTRALH